MVRGLLLRVAVALRPLRWTPTRLLARYIRGASLLVPRPYSSLQWAVVVAVVALLVALLARSAIPEGVVVVALA